MRASLVALLALTSCGDNLDGPIDAPRIDARMIDAAIDSVTPADAPDPRNATYALGNTNSANGILWDATAQKLFLTESYTNSLQFWEDTQHTFTIYTQFPLPTPATASVSLGDVLRNTDGSFYVTNFFAGNIVKAPPQTMPMGSAVVVNSSTNNMPDTARRRIGLSRNAAGDVYAATFTGGGGGPQVGAITKLTFAGGGGGGGGGTTATETVVVTGPSDGVTFKKLVGIVATNDAIFVTQQNQQGTTDSPDNVIFKVALPLPTNGDFPTVTTVATVPNTDMLAMLPGGDLLTGGKTKVHRVTQAGTVTAQDALGTFEQVRGIAYDAAMHRLFIINHSATVTTGDKLEIRPFTE